jgi:alpha-glucosidase
MESDRCPAFKDKEIVMRIATRLLTTAVVLIVLSHLALADVKYRNYETTWATLAVEVLTDDLVHFEAALPGQGHPTGQPIYTSPMVFNTKYPGPSSFTESGNVMETRDMRLEVNRSSLCVTVRDKARGNTYLTTICPDFDKDPKGLTIDPGAMKHVYGLGQQFKVYGSADGDWVSHGVREGGIFGNSFDGFHGGAVGNIQIPVMYALGPGTLNYALFIDNLYKQQWDFTSSPWKASMYGGQLRFYVMTGPDLPSLRVAYMELTGKPPVPPRKALGLWVSEFGYHNFGNIDALLAGLRQGTFPVDGFILDLTWFGGVVPNDPSKSRMGRLNWDEDQNDGNNYYFPNPGGKIKEYAADHVGLAAIEESYLADTPYVDTYTQMPANLLVYEQFNGRCEPDHRSNPASLSAFWGKGRMIDWSNPGAGVWIHDNRRYPNLAQKGVTTHWTDLGEPEAYPVTGSVATGCYEGVETTPSGLKNEEADVHDLYNLLWNKSIWEGYFDRRTQANDLGIVRPRPFILSRSGAAGSQRYGVAMWSGDIPSNLAALATHANSQMHMSLSGIDFYGSDAGGFRRECLPCNDDGGTYRAYDDENYTRWLANSTWFDVPLRPHTDNEFKNVFPRYATAPHLVGSRESNLANIRQRYELIPYYYSLAFRAHLYGEPLVPPLVFYYQDDPEVRTIGHEKLIGKDLLVGIVASYGEYERNIYLPRGKWVDYLSNEWFTSTGQWLSNVPEYRNGLFRLPVFARAGAILPQMAIDDSTLDAFGSRKAGAPGRNELIVRVYADATPTAFTLYEDDGVTLDYTTDGRPVYTYRTTEMSQRKTGSDVAIIIDPAQDHGAGAALQGLVRTRQNVVRLVVEDEEAVSVTLNNIPLTQHASEAAFNDATSGWINRGNNLVEAKSPPMDVYTAQKVFSFHLKRRPPTTSMDFVCHGGVTMPGESVYVVGNIPALGGPSWDTSKAIKLDPSVYGKYLVDKPPQGCRQGPDAPVWTGVIPGIPPHTAFEWKCIRKREDGRGPVVWQPGSNNAYQGAVDSGYGGSSSGSF